MTQLTADETGTSWSHLGFAAAALWPVKYGWFYLEGGHQHEKSEPIWTYGLLLREPLVDPSRLMSFFEALTDDPPRVQHQWPYRRLSASGTAGSPLARIEAVTDELVAPDGLDRPELGLLGTNPFYATAPEAIDTFPESVPSTLYTPLQRTSSLLYQPTFGLREGDEAGRQYAVDDIFVVEPPGINSIYVAATAKAAD